MTDNEDVKAVARPRSLRLTLEGCKVPDLELLKVFTDLASSIESTKDATGMINSLRRWPKVKDLVVHAQDAEQNRCTKIFQQVTRALTPSAASDECLCPAPERLSITTHTRSSAGLAQSAFTDDGTVVADDHQHYYHWVYGGALSRIPAVIGTDLSNLVQRRCSPPSSSDQVNSCCRSWSSLTLTVIGPLVDPVAWQRILEFDVPSFKWCFPDPTKFQGPRLKRETELFASVGRVDQEFVAVPVPPLINSDVFFVAGPT